MFYSYRKTIKTTSADGKTIEEVVEETSGPEARTKMSDATKEMDAQFKKMDTFFKKMRDAFKELE